MATEPPGTVNAVQRPRTRWTRWRAVARTTYRLIRANPTGRVALRAGVGLLGAAFFVLGVVLIPLPGPGWALVLLGLSVWAIEFVWARHLLRFTRQQLSHWIGWMRTQPGPIRLLLGTAGLALVATVAVLSLKYSFGIDVLADVWQYITTH